MVNDLLRPLVKLPTLSIATTVKVDSAVRRADHKASVFVRCKVGIRSPSVGIVYAGR